MAPSPPILSPDFQYVPYGQNASISWVHDPEGTGNGTQLARAFRWSINDGASWTTINRAVSTSNSRAITAQPGYDMLVQARTYDQDNVASDWSNSSVNRCLVEGQEIPPEPAAPTTAFVPGAVVTVGDLVSVTWTHDPGGGSDQVAYEVETSHDGGATWTSTGQVESPVAVRQLGTSGVPAALTVRVRTWGESYFPSEWSEAATVEFKNPEPEDPMAVLTPTQRLARTQSPYGLLSVATDLSSTVARWADGLTWPTLGTGGIQGAPGDPCAELDPISTDDTWSEATAFYVRSRYDCGLGDEGKEEAAALRLAALSRAVVEDQAWNGSLGAVPYLTSATEQLTTAAVAPPVAVGLVDQFIAQSYGSLGVVHMTKEAADVAFAAGVLEVRSGRLVTGMGTPVAVYATTGAGPGGTAPAAGSSWVYGTPAVSYWVQDLPPQNRVDITDNTWSSELTQRWVVGWDDTGVGAAQVDLT